jgi:PIN domain nuclease of toxin-antitoxin system
VSLLLDTHTFVWFFLGDDRLPSAVREAIIGYDGDIFVSAISAYEMAQKNRLGLWPEIAPILDDFDTLLESAHFAKLDITARHAIWAGRLKNGHRDPFDRILAAQAIIERLQMVSRDRQFEALGAQRIWK